MDSIVPQLSGAPSPEPVPVVVDDVVMEWSLRSRSLPQRIVQPLRYRRRLAGADGGSQRVVPGAREQHSADLAGFDAFDSLDHAGHGAPLCAELDDAFVLASRGDHHL